MGPGNVSQQQAVEQAKAQLEMTTVRTTTTTECIRILVEAGALPESAPEVASPLLIALCKVQLAQLRMHEQEGKNAITNLTEFIKRAENPLFGATLIPPTAKLRRS